MNDLNQLLKEILCLLDNRIEKLEKSMCKNYKDYNEKSTEDKILSLVITIEGTQWDLSGDDIAAILRIKLFGEEVGISIITCDNKN